MSRSISVIIPAFNRKDLLQKTLESIFNQTLPASEIIVVDDHSTDGTAAALQECYGNKVKVILNKGKGPGAARNTGMSAANGAYIKFFDSDDVMTRNTLQIQYDALQHSKKGFVYSPYFFCSEENGKWFSKDQVILNFYPLKTKLPLWHFMMVDGLFITVPGMLFQRELLTKVGPWREDVTSYEDWDFLFRLSMLEPHPAHSNACAFVYRLHGGQTTGQHFTNAQRDLDKVRVLQDLYQNVIKMDTRFSDCQRIFFLNKFYQARRLMQRTTGGNNFLSLYNNAVQYLVGQALRLRLKIGRLRTATDWQPCHGPLRSAAKIIHYMGLLNATAQ